jgi:parallel beta-helix repeat protein
MKKVSGLSVLVMLLFFLTFAGFSLIEVRAPDGVPVHNLNTGISYETIQEAIDANETLDGHTIHVDAGTYNENVVVDKQLSLIGDGAEVTIISAADSSYDAIGVTSDNVEISGFKITGATELYPSAAGIYFYYVSNVSISHNYITNNTYGICLSYSDDNTIVNNTICLNYFGINLENGNRNNAIIDNNSSSNTWYGIILWSGSDGNLVAHNIFLDNNRGISLGPSDSCVIAYNNVSGNSIGIEIQQISNDNTIYHNNIVDNDAQASSISGAVNVWNVSYPSGGNYWSDYSGVDLYYGVLQNETGWDGIGETAYTIDASNIDKYPLMAPINIFDAGTWNEVPQSIDIVSNSMISNFQLDTTQKTISFSATGEIGLGFCRVTVPNVVVQGMWQDSYTVLVNQQPVEFRDWIGAENTYIYFTYQHSTRNVVIIPEFSAVIVLPLLFMFAFVAIALQKRKQLGFS